MPSHLHVSLLALSLVACTTSPNDTATDATLGATDTTTTTTEATTTASPSTTGTPSTTSSTDATSSAASTAGTSGAPPLTCTPHEATLGEYSLGLTLWAPDFDPWGNDMTLEIGATCKVGVPSYGDSFVSVPMTCTGGANLDVPLSLSLTLDADIELPFAEDAMVLLNAVEHSFDLDGDRGGAFVLSDHDTSRILLAGVGDDQLSELNDLLAPFMVESIDVGCPIEDDVESSTRRALRVTDSADGELVVLDGQRGTLPAFDGPYEVLVQTALVSTKSGKESYRALVVAK